MFLRPLNRSLVCIADEQIPIELRLADINRVIAIVCLYLYVGLIIGVIIVVVWYKTK